MLSFLLTNAIVTAYCYTGQLDASSHQPIVGTSVATSLRDLPLGSSVVIDNHNYLITDHMNKRFNGTIRFDIYFGRATEKAKQFGIKKHQTVKVSIK